MFSRLAARLKLPIFELAHSRETEERQYSPLVTLYMIFVPLSVVLIFGVLMAFSSQTIINISNEADTFHSYIKPVFLLIIAVIAGGISAVFSPDFYRRIAPFFWLFSLLMQALVLTPLGASEGGNTNWIRIPGVPFLIQPSELLKLTSIIILAALMDRKGTRLGDWRQIGVLAGLPIVISVADIMLGHDMGTTLVVVAAYVGALFIVGLPRKWFIVLFLMLIPVGIIAVLYNPTRVARILVVLPGFKPERDLSKPEQIDHSLWALGSGGVFGLGPGASREKWEYLQAAHTDFILAIIGEEFGLLGTLLVVGALLTMILGMFRLAHNVDTLFEAMVVAGVATWIGAQAVINIATVTGLGPVIGVPLPFVSSGGSSLLFTTFAMGVVLSIARHDAGLTRHKKREMGTFGRDPRILPRKRSAQSASS